MSTDQSSPQTEALNSVPKMNRRASFGRSLLSFVLAILVILTLRWGVAEPYVIPSGSMIPTLLIHDHILVNKLAFGLRVPFTKKWLVQFGAPDRGDVVVFRSVEDDSFYMIKRVVGLPGDKVAVNEDAQLLINGEPVTARALGLKSETDDQGSYYRVSAFDVGGEISSFDFFEEKLGEAPHRIMQTIGGYRWPEEPYEVPAGHVFLMGDNRDNSRDSRVWGSLPMENLLGRASLVWLSCTQTLETAPFLCDPAQLRWKRLFHFIR